MDQRRQDEGRRRQRRRQLTPARGGTEIGFRIAPGRWAAVLGPEDLVVTKALAHGEETAHYWWDALAIIAKRDLDWDYLLGRARRGPRRMLSLLLYAQSTDLAVPDHVIRRLAADGRSVRTCRDAERRASSYLPEHLHEALLADERVGEQALARVGPTSTASTSPAPSPTEARRDAIVAVVERAGPGLGRSATTSRWSPCDAAARRRGRDRMTSVVRIAAVGDVHVGLDSGPVLGAARAARRGGRRAARRR